MDKARVTFIRNNEELDTIVTAYIPRIGEKVGIGEEFLIVVDVVYVYHLSMGKYTANVTIVLE